MNIVEQLLAGLGRPLRAPLGLRRRSFVLLACYLALAGALFWALGWVLVTHQGAIKQALLGYVLPQDWVASGELLLDWLVASQGRTVLVNGMISGGLVLVSVLLFPLKERVSLAFERDGALVDEPPRELPLRVQAVEELVLVLLYAGVQMGILWLGYHPHPARKAAATALSYLFLMGAFAIDFVSPVLQRRGLRYSQILKHLATRPVAALSFGALFTLPVVLVAHWVVRVPNLPLRSAVVLLFSVNLVAVAWGCIGGTALGAQLVERTRLVRRSGVMVRTLAWLVLLGWCAVGTYVGGALVLSVHHKSQLLKCDYGVAPGSLRLLRPGLGGLLRGKLELGLGFELQVRNPTGTPLVIDRNRIEIRHGKSLVALGQVTPLTVPGKGQVREPVTLRLQISPAALWKGRDLLQDRWSVTLYIELRPGLELPVYLKHNFSKSLIKSLFAGGD